MKRINLYGVWLCLLIGGFYPGQILAVEQYFIDPDTLVYCTAAETSRDVELGDVNGDKILDLLVANNGPNRLCLNDGNGNFYEVPAGTFPNDNDYSFDADFGDVDGDGDLDVFIANYNSQNRLYVNNGSGKFVNATGQLPIDANKSIEGAFGDVDNDGDLDIMVANNQDQNRLYLNNGSGIFTDATGRLPDETVTNPNNTPYPDCDADFGDVDGDNDLDLAIGHCATAGGQNRLLINDGSGFFTDETAARLPEILDVTIEIELGIADVNGDGHLDIIAANGGGGGKKQNRILMNYAPDGTNFGYFAEETGTRFPSFTDKTFDVDLADVDGDGDLDAIVANEDERSRLLINNNNGIFTDHTNANLPDLTLKTREADFGDVDGDNFPDLILANSNSTNNLWVNDGLGGFTDVTDARFVIDLDDSRDMDFGDVNDDGNLDVIVANNGQNRLYLNIMQKPAVIINMPPTAQIEGGQNLRLGGSVILDGNSSSDPENTPLFFVWSVISGPEGSTAQPDCPECTVTSFTPDIAGAYVIELYVNDGTSNSLPATFEVAAVNGPVPCAGPDQEVLVGSVLALDASCSIDPDNTIQAFDWQLVSLPAESTAALNGADTIDPDFTVDKPGVYQVCVRVDDGFGFTEPDCADITASFEIITYAVDSVKITPQSLNLGARGNNKKVCDPAGDQPMKAHMILATGVGLQDVDISTMRLTLTATPDCDLCNVPAIIGSESFDADENQLTVTFDRQTVIKMVANPGATSLTLNGSFVNGTVFSVADEIKARITSSGK